MRMRQRFFMISFALVTALVVGLGAIYLKGALRYGNVFSIKSFDAKAKFILVESLHINFTNQIEFKHASMLGGKDWTLYVCFEIPQTELENLLKSVTFTTRNGRDRDVPFEMAGLPWWKIEKENIDVVLCATEGYTAMIGLKSESGRRCVFAYTDGGRAGFPKAVWDMFKKQQ